MKKKYSVTSEDKKDWTDFTEKMENISLKEDDFLQENYERNKQLNQMSNIFFSKIKNNTIINEI